VGTKKRDLFFDQFLASFFGEEDAAWFKSVGLNCIRIAVNYRHFEGKHLPERLGSIEFNIC
jgi:hypothetical protein